jgi:hypothetical protein
MITLPLLDEACNCHDLLSAIASLRTQRAWLAGGHVTLDKREYLSPTKARLLFELIHGGVSADPYAGGASELGPSALRAVEVAEANIFQRMPQWGMYRSLPIRVLFTPNSGILSYSCLLYPQHIFLGGTSFLNNSELLIENFLHEYAHIWLYLLQEVAPFSANRNGLVYRLPSGTPGRSVTAVIDAAYVAAVLRLFYSRSAQTSRARELTAYLAGCLIQIRNDPDLTRIGLNVCRRLALEVCKAGQ